MGFPGDSVVKPKQETSVQSLGQEDPLETEMAIHSSILAWKIPQTEETAGLSMGLKKSQKTAKGAQQLDNSTSILTQQ